MLPEARCLRLSQELLLLSVPRLRPVHCLLRALAAAAHSVAAARAILQLEPLQETNNAAPLTDPVKATGHKTWYLIKLADVKVAGSQNQLGTC